MYGVLVTNEQSPRRESVWPAQSEPRGFLAPLIDLLGAIRLHRKSPNQSSTSNIPASSD